MTSMNYFLNLCQLVGSNVGSGQLFYIIFVFAASIRKHGAFTNKDWLAHNQYNVEPHDYRGLLFQWDSSS